MATSVDSPLPKKSLPIMQNVEGGDDDAALPRHLPTASHKRTRSQSGTKDLPILLSDSPVENDARSAEWTDAAILRRVLDVLPDISHDFVYGVCTFYENMGRRGADKCSHLLNRLANLETYPKERDVEIDRDLDVSIVATDSILTEETKIPGRVMLGNEFLNIPIAHIDVTLSKERSIYDAYETLWHASNARRRPYQKLNIPRSRRDPSTIEGEVHIINSIMKGITAARQKCNELKRRRWQAEKLAKKEAANERLVLQTGQVRECACCFTEVPKNRMTNCAGIELHYFCFNCTKANVETEMGMRKCRPKCMDLSGCGVDIPEAQLKLCLDAKTLRRLSRLQQQEELKAANINGLTECPFCDYMEICVPALIDREFRCQNPDCMVTSCRLCHRETHIPKSCQSAAEDKVQNKKANARHAIEEAMTDAMVRTCNKCKTRFVKEMGCNKMTCSYCANKQCYVCGVNVEGYGHFQTAFTKGICPLHDEQSVEIRHQIEADRAAEAVATKLREENPELEEDDLVIKVSAEVAKAEMEARELYNNPVLPANDLNLNVALVGFDDAMLGGAENVAQIARLQELQAQFEQQRPAMAERRAFGDPFYQAWRNELENVQRPVFRGIHMWHPDPQAQERFYRQQQILREELRLNPPYYTPQPVPPGNGMEEVNHQDLFANHFPPTFHRPDRRVGADQRQRREQVQRDIGALQANWEDWEGQNQPVQEPKRQKSYTHGHVWPESEARRNYIDYGVDQSWQKDTGQQENEEDRVDGFLNGRHGCSKSTNQSRRKNDTLNPQEQRSLNRQRNPQEQRVPTETGNVLVFNYVRDLRSRDSRGAVGRNSHVPPNPSDFTPAHATREGYSVQDDDAEISIRERAQRDPLTADQRVRLHEINSRYISPHTARNHHNIHPNPPGHPLPPIGRRSSAASALTNNIDSSTLSPSDHQMAPNAGFDTMRRREAFMHSPPSMYPAALSSTADVDSSVMRRRPSYHDRAMQSLCGGDTLNYHRAPTNAYLPHERMDIANNRTTMRPPYAMSRLGASQGYNQYPRQNVPATPSQNDDMIAMEDIRLDPRRWW